MLHHHAELCGVQRFSANVPSHTHGEFMQMAGDVVCGIMVKNMIESLKSVISEHDEVIAQCHYLKKMIQ